MILFLPIRWVYVWYEGGKTEDVVNSDTLTAEEAQECKNTWGNASKKGSSGNAGNSEQRHPKILNDFEKMIVTNLTF